MLAPPIAAFGGQQIFGEDGFFHAAALDRTTAEEIDTFLGLAPGTTIHGGDPGGTLWGVEGKLSGDGSGDVSQLLEDLMDHAGLLREFGVPTRDRFPAIYAYYPNCWFAAEEVVFSDITQGLGGKWECTYRMIVRQVAAGTV